MNQGITNPIANISNVIGQLDVGLTRAEKIFLEGLDENDFRFSSLAEKILNDILEKIQFDPDLVFLILILINRKVGPLSYNLVFRRDDWVYTLLYKGNDLYTTFNEREEGTLTDWELESLMDSLKRRSRRVSIEIGFGKEI